MVGTPRSGVNTPAVIFRNESAPAGSDGRADSGRARSRGATGPVLVSCCYFVNPTLVQSMFCAPANAP